MAASQASTRKTGCFRRSGMQRWMRTCFANSAQSGPASSRRAWEQSRRGEKRREREREKGLARRLPD
eukprot:998824-Rhodomonas_salina.2